MNQDGILIRTKESGPTFILKKPGDAFTVRAGMPFVLNVPDAVDLGTYALVVKDMDTAANPRDASYSVSLKESCTPYIEMDKRCRIVNWYNPYRLPEIRVRNNDDQLIMTPILNDERNIIGYEIRLGDHQYCGSPALEALKKARKDLDIKDVAFVFKPRPATTKKQPAQISDFVVGGTYRTD